MKNMTGREILHYTITKKLGEGGMGIVYLAMDRKLKREVAIKFLPRLIAADVDERRRFEIEAQAAAALNHPNIATIHAIEEAEDEVFIVMEYIAGQELRERIQAFGPLAPAAALDIARQIAEGLQAAHEKGIIHRDIKSANIMLDAKERVKVMDFGLAKVHGGAQVTRDGSTLGTAAYMSPEQATGGEVDLRTDIWSYGVVLYEMLNGALPFRGEYAQAVIFAILNEAPPELPDDGSPERALLRRVIEKCLSKAPEGRYASFTEVLRDLNRSEASTERVPATPVAEDVPPAAAAPGSTVSRKSLLAGVTAAIMALAALLFYFAGSRSPETDGPGEGVRIPVAVADFVNYTGESELDALSGMLITSLEQSRKLAVMSRSRMFDVLAQLGRREVKTIDEALGREICRQTDIHALVIPSIRKFGKLYTVDLKVLDPRSGEYVFTSKAQDEGQEQIPGLIDLLSEATRKSLRENEAEILAASRKIAEVTTPNLEAYEYYFRGETYLNQMQFEPAKAAFRQAIALDSTFGLAYYRLSYAMGWFAESLAEEPLHKAIKYIDKIPEKERYLVRAEEIRQSQGFAAGLPILHEMEKYYPNDKEMLFNIGDWAFHSQDLKTALAYFEKVLALDPNHLRTRFHYDQAVAVYYTRPEYFGGDRKRALAEAIKARDANPDNIAYSGAVALNYMEMGQFEEAIVDLQKVISGISNPQDLMQVRTWLFSNYAFTGRYRAAMEILRQGAAEARAQQEYGMVVLGGYFNGQLALRGWGDRSRIRETVQEIQALPVTPQIPFFYPNYAVMIALAGDLDGAWASLEAHPHPGNVVAESVIHSIAGECRESAEGLDPVMALPAPDFIKAQVLYALGECLFNHGDLERSAEMLEKAQSLTLSIEAPFQSVSYPRSLLILGKIHEAQEETAQARQYYRQLLDLWKNADADLQDLLEVRQRMAALGDA